MAYRIREQTDLYGETSFHVERGSWLWWETISGFGYKSLKGAQDRILSEIEWDKKRKASEKSIRYHNPPPWM